MIHDGLGEEMSGSRQHFIPRQFIRGFTNEHDSVWMYRSGKSGPVPQKRGKAASQHGFNSEEVDRAITDYEQRLDHLLSQLRVAPDGGTIDPELAAEVVSHLNHRTQSTRGTMSQMASGVFSLVREIAGSRETVARVLGLDQPIANARTKELLEQELDKLPFLSGTPNLRSTFQRVGYFFVREMFPVLFHTASAPMTDALVDLGEQSDSIVRDLHDKFSATPPKETGWYRTLSRLSWRIVYTSGAPLILPDCVALGMNDKGNWISLLTVGSSANSVVMPLTPNSVLIGGPQNLSIDPEHLNLCSAQASHLFFLAQKKHPQLDELQLMIGSANTDNLADLMETLRAGYTAQEEPIQNEANTTVVDSSGSHTDQNQIAWQIEFRDFADEETSLIIADALKPLIVAVAKSSDLSWLDGITFAIDYKSAVEELDRGLDDSAPIALTEIESQQSTSIPLLVRRENRFKYRIVTQGWVAKALMSGNEQTARIASSILCSQIMWVGLTGSREKTYPRAGSRVDRTTAREFLMTPVESVAIEYCSHRVSAPIAPELMENWSNQTIASLNKMHTEIPELRWSYRLHGDLDLLLNKSFRLIEVFLHRLAVYFAYVHELGNDFWDDGVDRALTQAGLTNWAALFASDLAATKEALPNWQSTDHLYLFGQHVERILLNYGILIEERPGETIYVHVPEASDYDRMIDWARENYDTA